MGDDELVGKAIAVALLQTLNRNGVPPDVQELLAVGDGRGTIAPGAIYKAARAALQVVKDAGWTPPISALDIVTGGSAYKVKLGPNGNLVYEPVDLYDNKNPANREARGERIE